MTARRTRTARAALHARVRLARLALAGAAEVIPLVRHDPRMAWVLRDGAAAFAAAIAAGDLAPDDDIEHRHARCMACPRRIPAYRRGRALPGRCGECDCPIGGLVAVASTRCPDDHWGPVDRVQPVTIGRT